MEFRVSHWLFTSDQPDQSGYHLLAQLQSSTFHHDLSDGRGVSAISKQAVGNSWDIFNTILATNNIPITETGSYLVNKANICEVILIQSVNG